MLSERQQKQRLYAIFAGGDTKPELQNADDFGEPWRSVLIKLTWFYAANAHNIGRTNGGIDWRTHYHDEILDCLAPASRVLRTHPHDVVAMLAEAGRQRRSFESLAQIEPYLPPITWLWEKWIPKGFMTLVGATPKTGKSWFALDLARIVINGGEWPDGQTAGGGGSVVWVEAEAVAQITSERARSLGVNTKHFWPLLPPRGDILDLAGGSARDDLIELVQHVKPQLVVIDSLSGITTKGENNIEDIRRLMAFLVGLAEDHGTGLMLIHHIKKLDRAQLALPGLSLYDFRGSGHITAAARSIIGLSLQSQANGPITKTGPRRLEVVAATLCETPDPLGMDITQLGDNSMAIVYGEAPATKGATQGDECARWLVDVLQANGPMRARDVIELAQAEGYERSMVYSARAKLLAANVLINTMGSNHPKNEWKLADDAEADDDEA